MGGPAEPTPEQIITAAIERHAKGDPAALVRAIPSALDAAGFEVSPKSDLIPIRAAICSASARERRYGTLPGLALIHINEA